MCNSNARISKYWTALTELHDRKISGSSTALILAKSFVTRSLTRDLFATAIITSRPESCAVTEKAWNKTIAYMQ